VRFRSPGKAGERTKFVDAIRGELEHDANRNDVVILKASDQSPRLPTYHFAHAVDDHLMRVNLVIRGEEWISSVPTHLQLFDALGFDRVEYAHIAPLMKQQGGSRRKLSKRKDPEASVEFFIEAGFPAPAVQYYMRGLVNARLAELPLAEALEAPISLAECGVAGPLVDLVKLDDICADYVATLSGEEIISLVSEWAETHDPELVTVLASERDAALAALQVERGPEVANPRKDLRKWADFRTAYGFFFPSLFPLVSDRTDERLGGLSPELISAFAADFADGYADLEDGQEWFGQIRELAAKHGFAPNPKELKKNPDAYPGSIREAAQLIRVALTGSKASPDLHAVARTLGADEVLRRVRALAG
jgi:glutamyl-tRNA synthetase